MRVRGSGIGVCLLLAGLLLAVGTASRAAALLPSLAWSRSYSNVDDDQLSTVATDAEGNVYVTGYSYQHPGDKTVTFKYDSAGNVASGWPKTFVHGQQTGGYGRYARTPALAVDGDGNVYVTVHGWNGTNYDFATIKYQADGSIAAGWPKYLNGASNDHDFPYAMILDEEGNVYVTGYSRTGGNDDFLTVKYDPAGNILSGWPRTLHGGGSNRDYARFLATDEEGNVYVAGLSYNGTHNDVLTVKYDAAGNVLPGWPKTYNGSGNGEDVPWALAVDGTGGIYISGYSATSSNGTDYLTLRYDADGDLQSGWPKTYNGSGNGRDEAWGMALDADGNVYVTGFSTNNSGNYDCVTIQYDSEGSVRPGWPQVYNGSGNQSEQAYALAVDTDRGVFVVGYTQQSSADSLVLKYAPDGTLVWSDVWDNPANGAQTDYGWSLALDARSNLYVGG